VTLRAIEAPASSRSPGFLPWPHTALPNELMFAGPLCSERANPFAHPICFEQLESVLVDQGHVEFDWSTAIWHWQIYSRGPSHPRSCQRLGGRGRAIGD